MYVYLYLNFFASVRLPPCPIEAHCTVPVGWKRRSKGPCGPAQSSAPALLRSCGYRPLRGATRFAHILGLGPCCRFAPVSPLGHFVRRPCHALAKVFSKMIRRLSEEVSEENKFVKISLGNYFVKTSFVKIKKWLFTLWVEEVL